MPIVFAAVAEERVVSYYHQLADGDFLSPVRLILDRMTGGNHRKTLVHENHAFHYIKDGDVVYIAVTDNEFPVRISFAFLEDIRDLFEEGSTDFEQVLEDQMEYHSYDPKADKVRDVSNKLRVLTDVMKENIESLLRRGEKIEDVLSGTETMSERSSQFKQKSVKLKKKYWWKNVKLCICLICCLIILMVIVFLIIFFVLADRCGGFKFPDCKI
eukprot:TRINITY_DN5738_c0_g1_i1.p1 TRINITY_DN5738_c0_g1~~TRINITY_DN5738_c0_g1_i1.p1  ORF type:complete len:214 (+),score=32.43 TRINITY_DN5738_c0_g1_i1:32-673(+)